MSESVYYQELAREISKANIFGRELNDEEIEKIDEIQKRLERPRNPLLSDEIIADDEEMEAMEERYAKVKKEVKEKNDLMLDGIDVYYKNFRYAQRLSFMKYKKELIDILVDWNSNLDLQEKKLKIIISPSE